MLVVVEVAFKRAHNAISHEPVVVAHRTQQGPVVRNEQHCTTKFLQRKRKRLARRHIQMVGGLVQQQNVRPLPDQQRKQQPGALAA